MLNRPGSVSCVISLHLSPLFLLPLSPLLQRYPLGTSSKTGVGGPSGFIPTEYWDPPHPPGKQSERLYQTADMMSLVLGDTFLEMP